MKLSDIVYGSWAIMPDMLEEIQGIYARHLRGDKINLDDLEAKTGVPMRSGSQGEIEVRDNVAMISIEGAIAKKMNLFSQISGGASTQMVQNQIQEALDDPSVKAILLQIDSPGGTVDGTFELADFIKRSTAIKPIEAITDGTVASGAYMIASATNAIWLTSPGKTNVIGSIGVLATHQYTPNEDGTIVTEIVSGVKKNLGTRNKPLDDKSLEMLQNQVEQLYEVFASSVVENRGIERGVVDSLEGGIVFGTESIKLGLADGVSTTEDVIKRLSGGSPEAKHKSHFTGKTMDINEFKSEYPDIYAEVHQLGVDEGKKAEMTRIQSVQEQCRKIPGHEKLMAELSFDGKTTGPEAAVAMLEAERVKTKAKDKEFEEDAPKPVPVEHEATTSKPAFATKKEEWAYDWNQSRELQSQFLTPEKYQAFMNLQSTGRVKVLGQQKGA